MRANLEIINDVLMNADLELDMTAKEFAALNDKLVDDWDQDKIPVDFTRKTLYRVFLDGRTDMVW